MKLVYQQELSFNLKGNSEIYSDHKDKNEQAMKRVFKHCLIP